jgi:hypothetical protein
MWGWCVLAINFSNLAPARRCARSRQDSFFRLYGPLEPWFNKTWRPSEIELVK